MSNANKLETAAVKMDEELGVISKALFEVQEVVETRRRNFTLAAAAGALVGTALTAMNDRSNGLTIGVTALFGGLATLGAYSNNALLMHEDNCENLGIAVGVVGAETVLLGLILNYAVGDKPEASE